MGSVFYVVCMTKFAPVLQSAWTIVASYAKCCQNDGPKIVQ
jgi:hypothetical protein